MFSIIIPTLLKEKEILNKLLIELNEDSLVDEIILIDNSTKGFLSDLKKVKTIVPKKNLFVNPAWNLGVKTAKNDYIGILNDDLLIPKNFIKEVYEFLSANKNVGVIGLDSVIIENTEKDDFDSYPLSLPLVFSKMEYKIQTAFFGSSMFMRKENYHKIPEKLKVWCGDNYILFKNYQNKKDIYEIKGVKIKHLKSLSCNDPKFDLIKKKDVFLFSKIDKNFIHHSRYEKFPSFLEKIFSLRRENGKKTLRILGFKIL